MPSVSEATTAWASGNLLASAGDLARAGDRLFGGEALSARSRREMIDWVKAIFKPPEYGLGLATEQLASAEVWGHSGDILRFHADLGYLPSSGVTGTALINYHGGDSEDKDLLAEQLIKDTRALRP